jgi:hypothetical protein
MHGMNERGETPLTYYKCTKKRDWQLLYATAVDTDARGICVLQKPGIL